MLSTLWLLSTERFKLPAAAAVLAAGALAIFTKESGVMVIAAIALILLYERKVRNRGLGTSLIGSLFAGLSAAFALYLGLRARSSAVPISFSGDPCCSYSLSLRVFSNNLVYYVEQTYGLVLLTAAAIVISLLLRGRRLNLSSLTRYDILFSVMLFSSAVAPFMLLAQEHEHYCYLPGIGAALGLGQLRGFDSNSSSTKPIFTLAALVPVALVIAFSVTSTVKDAHKWIQLAETNRSVLAQIAAEQPAMRHNTFVLLTYAETDWGNRFPEGFGDFAFPYALHDLYRDRTVGGLVHLQGAPYSIDADMYEIDFSYVGSRPPVVTKTAELTSHNP